MRILKLTNSPIPILVDDEDYEELRLFKWRLLPGKGYVVRSVWVNGKSTLEYLHRRIMNAPKGMDIDHKDLSAFNNQKSNLRLATRSQNMANSPRQSGHSKYKGVSKLERPNLKKPWLSYIRLEGKMYYNGYYDTEEEAAHIYNQFAEQAFGEFASLNSIS